MRHSQKLGSASDPPPKSERLSRKVNVGEQGVVRNKWLARIVDLLFPQQAECPLCQHPFRHEAHGWSRVHLCAQCQHDVKEITGSVCRICGRPDSGAVCPECEKGNHLFFSARSYGRYAGTLEEAIKAYKYQGQRELRSVLGEYVTQAYLRYYGAERGMIVVPVPMHPDKKANRGFNQSEELAKYLCSALKLPYADVLVRDVIGESQTLHRKNERKNLEGVFSMTSHSIQGQSVLLVDDVLTTGSTADACAKVLFEHGVVAVHVLTVAR